MAAMAYTLGQVMGGDPVHAVDVFEQQPEMNTVVWRASAAGFGWWVAAFASEVHCCVSTFIYVHRMCLCCGLISTSIVHVIATSCYCSHLSIHTPTYVQTCRQEHFSPYVCVSA